MKGFMNAPEKVPSYSEWVAELEAAGLRPDLAEDRYNKEVAQCNQADLNPPKFREGSTRKWKGRRDSPATRDACVITSWMVNDLYARTHQRFTRKIG